MPSLLLGTGRVAYSKVGSGPPVVLVHGSFATSSAWRKVVANLDTDRISVVAIDLPGCGDSDAAKMDSSTLLALEAAAVEAILEEESTGEPVRLIGHSHGGTIALTVALGGRARISSLLLFEPLPLAFLADTGDAETVDEIIAFVADYRRAFEDGDPWAVRRVIDLWGGAGTFEAMLSQARETMAISTTQNICQWESNLAFHPPLDSYRLLRIPTTLVCGERSNPISRLISQRLHELIPESDLIEIPAASHFMIHTHAAESAKLVGPTRR